MLHINFSFFFFFFNSKLSAVENLNPLNPDNKSITLFSIVDSVSLDHSSGLRELKILMLQVLE